MWNFFFRRRQRPQAQGLRFTVIAPETRGQDETMALRENINDLGAAAALQQAIEASRPRSNRTMTSQTMSLHVRTHVSAVSDDSEDFIRNPYSDTGRRQQRQAVASPTSPLAVASPAHIADSIDEDYVEVDSPSGEEEQQPQGIRRNLIMDPVGTLLHITAAAALTAGPPGREYITSGPPPPEQRGRRSQSCSSVHLPPPSRPLSPVLTQRPRAISNPVYSDRPRIHTRSRVHCKYIQ